MMRLSFMLNFLKSDIVDKIIKRFEHDEEQYQFFRASANILFVYKNKNKSYFLRMNHEDERSYSLIDNEIKLVNYLRSKGIPIAKPILSLNQKYIETFDTPLGKIHAVVFEGIQGTIYDEVDELNLSKMYEWGESLGILHETLKRIPNEMIFQRPSYEDLLNNIANLCKDDIIQKEINDIIKLCSNLPKTKDNYGLIHYDYELDNVIWTEDKIYSIDYDDCSYGWYVADINYATMDNTNNEKLNQFLAGYKMHTSFDEHIYKEKELFNRIHQLNTYARLYRAVDLEVNENNPEWMNNLIKKLQFKMNELYQTFK